MNNEITHVEKVADVIQVMQAGISFYKHALSEIDDVTVKTTFRKMISNKESAIDSLQPLAIAEQGERETGSDLGVESRKMYTKIAGMFSTNEEFTYVNQLEEVEDKVLEVLDEALAVDQPSSAMVALRTIRARAQSMHDEMKALQHAVKH